MTLGELAEYTETAMRWARAGEMVDALEDAGYSVRCSARALELWRAGEMLAEVEPTDRPDDDVWALAAPVLVDEWAARIDGGEA